MKTNRAVMRLLRRSRRPSGYVLHEDAFRVVIATGFARPTVNRKTGRMIQVWILAKSASPVDAVRSGDDVAICGGCIHRARLVNGVRVKRTCYVNVGQAPTSVYRTWKAGKYPPLPSVDVFAGRKVRWGAYGDPAFIPFALVRDISAASAGWSGYTHQWKRPTSSGLRAYLMASVDNDAERDTAHAAGWRTFRVVPKGQRPVGDVDGECPSERGVSCADCLRCCGTANASRSIWIEAHGSGARSFTGLPAVSA